MKWVIFFLIPFQCLVQSAVLIPEHKTDVVVLGGGVGGLTSAIYLARGGVPPLVIQGRDPGGALVQSKSVQNWPGEGDTTGMELVGKIKRQAESNGAVLSNEEMVSIDLSSKPFSMIVQDVNEPEKKRKILADACIVAMGTKHRSLGVSGEKAYEAKGVYTCAVCDGPLYKNKEVAVIGGADSAILETDYLSSLAKKVYWIVRGDRIKGFEKKRRDRVLAKKNVEVLYESEISGIEGSGASVEKIVVSQKKGRKEIPVEAVFLAIGAVPNTEPFKGQLELDGEGYIVLKNGTETSVPGVFAVGDVTDRVFKQAVSAAGEGAKAAIRAQDYLSSAQTEVRVVAAVDSKGEKPSDRVIEVHDLSELNRILNTSTVPVLVDFYASWCSPCNYLSPFIDSWAKELKGRFIVCKVNIEIGEELKRRYHIQSMPTLVHLNRDGSEVARKVGPREIIGYVNSLK